MLTSVRLSSSPEGRQLLLRMTGKRSRSVLKVRMVSHIPQKTGTEKDALRVEESAAGWGCPIPPSTCDPHQHHLYDATGGYLGWEKLEKKYIYIFSPLIGRAKQDPGSDVCRGCVGTRSDAVSAHPQLLWRWQGKDANRAGQVLKPALHPQRPDVHSSTQTISPPCTPQLFCWWWRQAENWGLQLPMSSQRPGAVERVGFLLLVGGKDKISPLISAWASRWHRIHTVGDKEEHRW